MKKLLLMLVMLLCVSSVFATATIVPRAECTDPGESIIVYLSDKENAHAALYGDAIHNAADFPYALCYASTSGYNIGTSRTCTGTNKLFSLYETYNSHIATNDARYTYDVCLGELACRSVTGSPNLQTGEQIIAQLSGETNAHLSPSGAANAFYPTYIICKTPVCNDATLNAKNGVSNLLYDFEKDEDFTNANKLINFPPVGDVDIVQDATTSITGSKSLKLTFHPTNVESVSLAINSVNTISFYVKSAELVPTLTIIRATGNPQVKNLYELAPQGLFVNQWSLIQIPASNIEVKSIVFNWPSVDAEKSYDFYIDAVSVGANQYCTQKNNVFSWKTDITDSNENSCQKILNYKWTGSKCCGQVGQFYTDTAGGCYNGVKVIDTVFDKTEFSINDNMYGAFCQGNSCTVPLSSEAVKETNLLVNAKFSDGTNPSSAIQSVIISQQNPSYAFNKTKGPFLVCEQNAKTFLSDKSVMSTLFYPLNEGQVCEKINGFSCGPDGKFIRDVAQYFKRSDPVTPTKIGCCPARSCFYDSTCYADQSQVENPQTVPMTISGKNVNNRCVAGMWSSNPAQIGVDGKLGYCQDVNQCFIKASSQRACANNGEWIGDHLCKNGNWSTRTVLIAQELQDEAGNSDYTIYCDNYQRVFVNKQSLLVSKLPSSTEPLSIADAFKQISSDELGRDIDNINSFCYLQYGTKGVLKVSMLENINDSVDRTFARILNITSPNAKTNGYDANCFTDGKCYHRTFNNPKGIVSNWKNSSSDVTMTYRSDSGNFISNAWVAISDFFTGIFNYFSGNNVVLELDNTKPYDQLYIYHKGNVHVEGLSYQRSFTPADGSYYTMRFYYITIKGASDSYCKFISVTTPDGLTVSCTYDAVTEISAIKAESDITDGAPDLFLPTWSGIISNLP